MNDMNASGFGAARAAQPNEIPADAAQAAASAQQFDNAREPIGIVLEIAGSGLGRQTGRCESDCEWF